MKKNKILGVIPARFESSRLPRKMLINISGKPLIQWTYEQAKQSKLVDAIVIATDSREIAEVARGFGADVIMTSVRHKNGTDRVCEAVKKFKKFKPDIVVNIFGDEPVIDPKTIDASIKVLLDNPQVPVSSVGAILSKNEIRRESLVKLSIDANGCVMYLSRSPIPYHYNKKETPRYCHILGSMAFRVDFLFTYQKLPQSSLELVEGVEQLRILENGYKMKVAVGNFDGIGVNTPEDLRRVRAIIRIKNHANRKNKKKD